MTRQAQEEEKVRQLAIDYNKKMEKIKKSIDSKRWEHIYESPEN